MGRYRNLLFSALAVRSGYIHPAQLASAGTDWLDDDSAELSDRLVDSGSITAAVREDIEHDVDKTIAEHGGDVLTALGELGGAASLAESFRWSIMLLDGDGSDQPDTSKVCPEANRTTERYTRAREHARGGMGRILLVRDESIGRDIALKELLPSSTPRHTDHASPAPSPLFMKRFMQEARITGLLEHPSIVPIYEVGHRPDGSPYYTMKFVRGKSLSDVITAAPSFHERLKLLPHFLSLCNAIAYAHSRGVIHRDIKPGNVMIGEFGETVVIDWGLAKAEDGIDFHAEEFADTVHALLRDRQGDAAKTAYGQALGTPAYMPPEQAEGRMDAVDEVSDVYALGAVLYELLTARPPYQASSPQEILAGVSSTKPPAILAVEPDASPELAAVCRKAMARRKEDRYQSAKELAEEIERFLGGGVVDAYTYRPLEHARRFVRRHRSAVSIAAAALVLLILIGSLAIWRISRARDDALLARDQARIERELALQQRDLVLNSMDTLTYTVPQGISGAPGAYPRLRERLEDNLQKLEDVLSLHPNMFEARRLKADNLRGLATARRVLGERDRAIEAATASVSLFDVLLDENPSSTTLRLGRASSLMELAACQDPARLDERRPYYRAARQEYERIRTLGPDGDLSPSDLASCHLALGGIHWYANTYWGEDSLDDAWNAFVEARHIYQRLHDNGEYEYALRKIAETYYKTAGVHRIRSEHEKAASDYRKAVQLYEEVLADRPHLITVKHELAGAYRYLGSVLRQTPKLDAAEKAHRAAIRISEELMAVDPNNLAVLKMLAASHYELSWLLLRRQDYAAVRDNIEISISTHKQILSREQNDPTYRAGLAKCHGLLSSGYSGVGEFEKAHDAIRASRELFETLVVEDPQRKSYQVGYASTYEYEGVAYARADDDAAARKSYEEGLRLFAPLLKAEPETELWQTPLNNLMNVGERYGKKGEFETAIDVYETGMDYYANDVPGEKFALTTIERAFEVYKLAISAYKSTNKMERMGPLREQFLAILDRIKLVEPDIYEKQNTIAAAYLFVAASFEREDKTGRAVETYSLARNHLEAMVQTRPDDQMAHRMRQRADRKIANYKG